MTSSPTTTDSTLGMLAERKRECLGQLNETIIEETRDSTAPFCRRTWDDWLCWPDTAAGVSAYLPCPDFVFGFDTTKYAHKDCDENGNWFRHPETNKTWSNYTSCIDFNDFEWRTTVRTIAETGYSISLIALILSLGLLSYFRSLKCARITLHMNLFASFAINNTLWLLWYRLVLADPEVVKGNGAPCIALHIVLHYFLLTNYAWMLCEGFYLHTVLVWAFVSEKKLVRWLVVLGWATPGIVIILYAVLRAHAGDPDDTLCWMYESANVQSVLIGPVCISMLLNLVFLCNIVRVVLLKLKAPAGPQGTGPSRTVLQAFRATLLLVPLLGLQYMLTPFQPDPGHPYERTYEIISAFTSSFQGLFVAVLFCFCNGEVIAQVKRKWRNVFLRTRTNSYTATQVSLKPRHASVITVTSTYC
ncbi:calcitonin gene-related peptide type 1 receptor isoform X2 [Uranotaenia lowii]|uniref:calcitonin gene-related peptide type 1 receptor isoform X2 n=1 Tax=Uranotaenia lowii TaxID=190385 RepID=UPI0024788396|nr:calcitonin gene-related peptide type 1 receptor isoform X2 [Uranotaenia lowii]